MKTCGFGIDQDGIFPAHYPRVRAQGAHRRQRPSSIHARGREESRYKNYTSGRSSDNSAPAVEVDNRYTLQHLPAVPMPCGKRWGNHLSLRAVTIRLFLTPPVPRRDRLLFFATSPSRRRRGDAIPAFINILGRGLEDVVTCLSRELTVGKVAEEPVNSRLMLSGVFPSPPAGQ